MKQKLVYTADSDILSMALFSQNNILAIATQTQISLIHIDESKKVATYIKVGKYDYQGGLIVDRLI